MLKCKAIGLHTVLTIGHQSSNIDFLAYAATTFHLLVILVFGSLAILVLGKFCFDYVRRVTYERESF